jgi:hypothetical protein
MAPIAAFPRRWTIRRYITAQIVPVAFTAARRPSRRRDAWVRERGGGGAGLRNLLGGIDPQAGEFGQAVFRLLMVREETRPSVDRAGGDDPRLSAILPTSTSGVAISPEAPPCMPKAVGEPPSARSRWSAAVAGSVSPSVFLPLSAESLISAQKWTDAQLLFGPAG